MSKLTKIKGTGVAIVTPFGKDGAVDFKALNKLINHIITGGVEYVALFVGLHFLFVAYSYIIHVNRISTDKKAT